MIKVASEDFQSPDFKASKLTKKALENQIIELMKQKPSITQVEIAEQVELSRTKVQSVITWKIEIKIGEFKTEYAAKSAFITDLFKLFL